MPDLATENIFFQMAQGLIYSVVVLCLNELKFIFIYDMSVDKQI